MADGAKVFGAEAAPTALDEVLGLLRGDVREETNLQHGGLAREVGAGMLGSWEAGVLDGHGPVWFSKYCPIFRGEPFKVPVA